MLITFESLFPQPVVHKVIRRQAHPNQRIFLVGGAIRDVLLNQPSRDFDFVVNGDAIHLARQVASELKAGFYILDDERKTARVILQNSGGGALLPRFRENAGFSHRAGFKSPRFHG